MKKADEAMLNMFHKVISYADTRPDVIAMMPAMAASYAEFKTIVAELTAMLQLRSKIISGYAMDKGKLHDALIQETISISSKIFSYTTAVDNNVLRESVDLTVWKLERLKDEELAPVCLNVSEAATSFLAELAPYNITSAKIDSFNDHIREYKLWVPLPQNAISARRKYVVSLKQLFKKAIDLLKLHLDRQVIEFKQLQPDFFSLYMNTREIIDNPRTNTQIKGRLINANTNGPVTDATVTILENKMSVNTDADGRFTIKTMAPGSFTLRVDKEGFKPMTVKADVVKLGKITKMRIKMLPKG